MSAKNFDIAIIGAGVVGLMSALFLRQQGLKVLVLEKNVAVAKEASRAGGGIISPLHPWRYSKAMLELASWSHQYYPDIVKQLSIYSGQDVPLIQTGMLVPNTQEADNALQCSFLQSRLLSSEQVYELEPALELTQSAVFVEGVCNVRNPALCKAMPIALQKLGVQIYTNINIKDINTVSQQWQIQTSNQSFSADKLVICAGAWSSELFNLFSSQQVQQARPEIFPVKGQMLAIKSKPGVLRTIVLENNRYLIPRHDGLVIVGSTVENAGFDKITSKESEAELLAFAHEKLPTLRYSPVISHWAGLRPGSHRDRPFISTVDGMDNLFVNVGHFRNGLLSAPASAQLLTDLVLNKKSVFKIDEYSL